MKGEPEGDFDLGWPVASAPRGAKLSRRLTLARKATSADLGRADPIVADGRARLAERLALAARVTGAGAWEWRLDRGTFTCDALARGLFDLRPDEPINLAALTRRLAAEDRARFAAELDDAARGLAALDTRVRVRAADGGWRWIRCAADLVRDPAGRPLRLVGASWDETAIQRLDEAVHDERERLQATLGAVADGVVATTADGRVAFLNAAAVKLLARAESEAVDRPVEEVLPLELDGSPGLGVRLDAVQRSGRAPPAPWSGRLAERDVEVTAAPMRRQGGEVQGVILVLRDVTEQRALERRLRHAARHDALTGLPNRTQVEERLAASPEGGGVLCYLDIDQFKIINDTAGHAAGDEFLRQVGALFQRRLEPGDLLARLGGDEFAWVMHEADLDAAEARARRLVEDVAAFRFHWAGQVFSSGVSAGLARREPGLTPTELLSRADVACYAAKAEGRGRTALYRADEASVAARHREIGVAASLREVIRQGRLTLHAQPIAAARGQEAGGYVELLVRMIGEDGALVPPGAFIPAAERFDLMGEIDRWVVEEALIRRGAEIAAVDGLRLGLNLSGNALNDPALLDWILDAVARSPVRSERLTFEVTETAALNNLGAAARFMERLREAGCRIALDDFGVGLSSFAYLKSFPVDCVKIDGSFVRNIVSDPKDLAIVETMNTLAHRLGAQTVAEFVEDAAAAELLRALGVDYLQGYGIGRPEPLTQALAAARSRLIGTVGQNVAVLNALAAE